MAAELIVITVTGFLLSTLNVLHVILGRLMTGPNHIYLGSGTYFLDYFYYLQYIGQGLRGAWLARQFSATDDPSIYIHLEPYIFLGKIGSLFGLTAVTTYWIAVFLLTLSTVLLIYLVINRLLRNESFLIRISALFISLFATSFPNRLLWYSPSSFFERFRPIPHHLLSILIILLSAVFLEKIFENISRISYKKIIVLTAFISILLVVAFSFYPYPIILVGAGIGFMTLCYFFEGVFNTKKRFLINKSLVFILVLAVIFFPLAFFIRNLYYNTVFFSTTKNVETSFNQYNPFLYVLGNIGPVLIFLPFGLIEYFRKINPLRLFFLGFVLISYVLYMTPVAVMLGSHNGRFLSPLSFVFFGTTCVLGVKFLAGFFGRLKNTILCVIVLIFLFFSISPLIKEHQWHMRDPNVFSPITYLSRGIIDGLVYLNSDQDTRAVLTTPRLYLGVIVPIYVNKHVYIARESATPMFGDKAVASDNFFLGRLLHNDAKKFLDDNKIGFVILTTIERYSEEPLQRYYFLKEIYRNPDIVIFKNTL